MYLRWILPFRRSTISTPIPKLTLITLVENSIFYGLSKKGVNHIIVSGKNTEADSVVLEVSDTGPGIASGEACIADGRYGDCRIRIKD